MQDQKADFIFLRHAESGKAKHDQDKPITKTGILQARTRAKQLNTLAPFDLVIVSSALRTQQTAESIIKTLHINLPMVSIDALYQAINPTLANNSRQDWANLTYNEILKTTQEYKAKHVLIIGHLHIINAIGLIFSPLAHELTQYNFANCEGFWVDMDGRFRMICD